LGFPIRISTDRSLVGSSPWLFAATHVLHRLQAPRHPPLALCSLENKDARARSGVLKELTRPSPKGALRRAKQHERSPSRGRRRRSEGSVNAPRKRNRSFENARQSLATSDQRGSRWP